MNIRPVSDLRHYSDVLRDCEEGSPVYLTKNGKGAYVVETIKEYNKRIATLKLLEELEKGEQCTKTYTVEEVKKSLGLYNEVKL
jgi:prevent-host-death family protein